MRWYRYPEPKSRLRTQSEWRLDSPFVIRTKGVAVHYHRPWSGMTIDHEFYLWLDHWSDGRFVDREEYLFALRDPDTYYVMDLL